jgi:hypothetical protein
MKTEGKPVISLVFPKQAEKSYPKQAIQNVGPAKLVVIHSTEYLLLPDP